MAPHLPFVSPGQVVGILEIVEEYKGSVEAARLAKDFDLRIDELLPVVEAAEMLDFAKVTDGLISLTPAGHKVLKGSTRQRKSIFKDQAINTPIFSDVIAKMQASGGRMSREALGEVLAFKLWTSDQETALRLVIHWGRYAGILTYDADTHQVTLV